MIGNAVLHHYDDKFMTYYEDSGILSKKEF